MRCAEADLARLEELEQVGMKTVDDVRLGARRLA